MNHENENPISASPGYCGPAGLGAEAAAVLGKCDAAGESLGGMAAQEYLRRWAEKAGHLIKESDWSSLKLVSAATAEHEVRYRAADHRAVKKTWPGTFGFIPGRRGSQWLPVPATEQEYLLRQHLQNVLFQDDIRLEGIMVSEGPSMIIGQPSGGISFVISQQWIEAADPVKPHPDEKQIAGYMRERGFTPLFAALFGWMHEDDSYIILDAKPDNFVLTHRGILPIDLLITAIVPDAAEDGMAAGLDG